MELALQSSLFEAADRRHLGNGAWVEVRSGWLTDADELFGEETYYAKVDVTLPEPQKRKWEKRNGDGE
jgi:hypothetical protein